VIRHRYHPTGPDRGQATVELALVLPLVAMLTLAIVQVALVARDQNLVTHAAREAARAGTIYQYDGNEGQGQNDLLRCQAILAAAQQSLDVGVPGQFSGNCTAVTGGADLAISYPDSATCAGSSRSGCQLRVTLTYRQPLLVPLVGGFFASGGGNNILLKANVTMVLN
jgi:Flp pilus assembly protein TadG